MIRVLLSSHWKSIAIIFIFVVLVGIGGYYGGYISTPIITTTSTAISTSTQTTTDLTTKTATTTNLSTETEKTTTLIIGDPATVSITTTQYSTITETMTYTSTSSTNTPQIPKLQFTPEFVGIVTRVIDGDTIDVKSLGLFKKGETVRVRLADIDAPERSESGGSASTSALYEQINGEIIFLDIDNLSIYDPYGRVVAVVYLPFDDSTALNVNEWLVINGYASIDDYDTNEFDPYTWELWYLWE